MHDGTPPEGLDGLPLAQYPDLVLPPVARRSWRDREAVAIGAQSVKDRVQGEPLTRVLPLVVDHPTRNPKALDRDLIAADLPLSLVAGASETIASTRGSRLIRR